MCTYTPDAANPDAAGTVLRVTATYFDGTGSGGSDTARATIKVLASGANTAARGDIDRRDYRLCIPRKQ